MRELDAGREALRQGEAELAGARKTLGDLDLKRLEAEREVAADEARLRSLEDLQNAHADLEEGARALLESVENLGTVAHSGTLAFLHGAEGGLITERENRGQIKT